MSSANASGTSSYNAEPHICAESLAFFTCCESAGCLGVTSSGSTHPPPLSPRVREYSPWELHCHSEWLSPLNNIKHARFLAHVACVRTQLCAFMPQMPNVCTLCTQMSTHRSFLASIRETAATARIAAASLDSAAQHVATEPPWRVFENTFTRGKNCWR